MSLTGNRVDFMRGRQALHCNLFDRFRTPVSREQSDPVSKTYVLPSLGGVASNRALKGERRGGERRKEAGTRREEMRERTREEREEGGERIEDRGEMREERKGRR